MGVFGNAGEFSNLNSKLSFLSVAEGLRPSTTSTKTISALKLEYTHLYDTKMGAQTQALPSKARLLNSLIGSMFQKRVQPLQLLLFLHHGQ